ncbi:choice-of-anchor L domain-containing protein [Chryseobacterium sp.]|uniref:choice-of-anchor L domain-containing protein n=1 Tax=Chryseobacterium sp. TaxID=1871047 RepID=UPI0028988925|nr:choice-of-anchor L domain-containing protein [Chryseobacterium sp.]
MKNNMKQKLLLLFFGILTVNISAQKVKPRTPEKENHFASPYVKKAGAFIDVNTPTYTESSFTPLQLIRDVLISTGAGSCFVPNISNVTVSPNLSVTDQNRSWGYFNRGTTNFPFADGIVLSTGYVYKAGNQDYGGLSDPLTTGSDPDLVAATNPLGTLNDAVLLEFDFVPTTSQIQFNYLFASEEYTSSFPCGDFSDAFALLLRPVGSTAPYQNMAVLPAGAGPVSVTNIVPSNYSCGPINAQYFAGQNTGNIETNFNGRTIPLTATATVIPGQAYHFKLAIADAVDRGYDSAVFLEGGSFNIGVELQDPSGAVIPEDINVCDLVPTVINASVNSSNLTYQWFFNGNPVAGATGTSITAIDPGTYTIEVTLPGNPCPGTASVTIHGGSTPLAQDATLLLCATPDITTFDLNNSKSLISPTAGANFRWYENQADALAFNGNYIQTPLNYNGANGQVLYVVVYGEEYCRKMVELTLAKENRPVAQVTSTRIRACAGESVTLTATGGVTYDWVNFPGNGNTQTVTVNQTTTFEVFALGALGCPSLNPARITVEVVPVPTTPLLDVEMCIGDSIELDAGAGNGFSYLWNTGEETQKITVNQLGIYTVEVDNGICSQLFEVKVVGAATPFFTQVNYENNTVTAIATIPTMNNIPMNAEYSIDGISWQDSNVFPNLVDNTKYTLYVRTKGTSCVGTLEIFTLHISNVITPNEDGVNDVIDLSSLGNFKNFKGSIYDRYGTEMFRFSKENPIWNGTVGGKRLPTGTYWYKFNFEYDKSKTQMHTAGWIMLKNRE